MAWQDTEDGRTIWVTTEDDAVIPAGDPRWNGDHLPRVRPERDPETEGYWSDLRNFWGL